MKKMKWMLFLVMMCLATVGKAQVRSMPNTQKDYYVYSWVQLRWADKANGEPCIVILESSGLGNKQKPTIMKMSDGRSVVFSTMVDGLNYLEQQGWELLFEEHNSFSNLLIRRKVTKELLDKAVKENTYYEAITPKVQLTLPEKNAHIDYD